MPGEVLHELMSCVAGTYIKDNGMTEAGLDEISDLETLRQQEVQAIEQLKQDGGLAFKAEFLEHWEKFFKALKLQLCDNFQDDDNVFSTHHFPKELKKLAILCSKIQIYLFEMRGKVDISPVDKKKKLMELNEKVLGKDMGDNFWYRVYKALAVLGGVDVKEDNGRSLPAEDIVRESLAGLDKIYKNGIGVKEPLPSFLREGAYIIRLEGQVESDGQVDDKLLQSVMEKWTPAGEDEDVDIGTRAKNMMTKVEKLLEVWKHYQDLQRQVDAITVGKVGAAGAAKEGKGGGAASGSADGKRKMDEVDGKVGGKVGGMTAKRFKGMMDPSLCAMLMNDETTKTTEALLFSRRIEETILSHVKEASLHVHYMEGLGNTAVHEALSEEVTGKNLYKVMYVLMLYIELYEKRAMMSFILMTIAKSFQECEEREFTTGILIDKKTIKDLAMDRFALSAAQVHQMLDTKVDIDYFKEMVGVKMDDEEQMIAFCNALRLDF